MIIGCHHGTAECEYSAGRATMSRGNGRVWVQRRLDWMPPWECRVWVQRRQGIVHFMSDQHDLLEIVCMCITRIMLVWYISHNDRLYDLLEIVCMCITRIMLVWYISHNDRLYDMLVCVYMYNTYYVGVIHIPQW